MCSIFRNIFAALLFFLFAYTSLSAQVYNNSLGGSVGGISGLSYKRFLDQPRDNAIFFNSFSLYAGYRQNTPLTSISHDSSYLPQKFIGYGLDVYKSLNYVLSRYLIFNIGLGWGIGVDDYNLHAVEHDQALIERSRFRYAGAVLGVLGLEYVMLHKPITIEIAFTTRFEAWYLTKFFAGFNLFSPALSLKYIIN